MAAKNSCDFHLLENCVQGSLVLVGEEELVTVAMAVEFFDQVMLVLHKVLILAKSDPQRDQIISFVQFWQFLLNLFENRVKKELVFQIYFLTICKSGK